MELGFGMVGRTGRGEESSARPAYDAAPGPDAAEPERDAPGACAHTQVYSDKHRASKYVLPPIKR